MEAHPRPWSCEPQRINDKTCQMLWKILDHNGACVLVVRDPLVAEHVTLAVNSYDRGMLAQIRSNNAPPELAPPLPQTRIYHPRRNQGLRKFLLETFAGKMVATADILVRARVEWDGDTPPAEKSVRASLSSMRREGAIQHPGRGLWIFPPKE